MKAVSSIAERNQISEIEEKIDFFDSDDFIAVDKIKIDSEKRIMGHQSEALMNLISLSKGKRKQVDWKIVFGGIEFIGDEKKGRDKVLYHYYNKRSVKSRKETKKKKFYDMLKKQIAIKSIILFK